MMTFAIDCAGLTSRLSTWDRNATRWSLPAGAWTYGEWDREMRVITFTWSDETEWQAQYDPVGNAMLFETTVAGAEATILRRIFR